MHILHLFVTNYCCYANSGIVVYLVTRAVQRNKSLNIDANSTFIVYFVTYN